MKKMKITKEFVFFFFFRNSSKEHKLNKGRKYKTVKNEIAKLKEEPKREELVGIYFEKCEKLVSFPFL